MTTFLTPESPLGLAVQHLLLGEPSGLTVPEIRRRLRHSGKVAEERTLRQLLSHARTFLALAGDRYALVETTGTASSTSRPERPADGTGLSHEGAADQAAMDMPFLVNLSRAVTDYVVLDLETTGLDPAQDRIVQLVAIRYRAGQPNAALNLYVNPAPSCHPIDRAGQDRADGPSRTAGPHRAGRPA